jgi:hypothetical protein
VSAEVHPTGTGPLLVAAGTAGPLVPFSERAGVDPATGRLVLYLRIAQIDGDPTAPGPGVRLAAGTGPAADIGTAPTAIHTDPAAGPVALATRTDEPDALTLVEVEVLQPDSPWQLQILNTDSAGHRYVWVVADTDDGTRRPWLDLPTAALTLRTNVGEAARSRDLAVANHGPGPLTLDDPDGTVLGTGFTLLSVTPRPIGANRRGAARITFTPPVEPVHLAVERTFTSNDPGAGATAGHNNRVALTAVVGERARWKAGDVLVLDQLTLARLDRATGLPVAVITGNANASDVAVDPRTGDAVLLGPAGVRRVDRFTGAQTSVFRFPQALAAPTGVAVDRGGAIVVLFGIARLLIRITRDGDRDSIDTGGLGTPRDMALEANGDVVVAGSGAAVLRIGRFGSVTTVSADGELAGPSGGPLAIAVEGDGTIVTARESDVTVGPVTVPGGTLVRVDPQSGQQAGFARRLELRTPAALAVAADGTIVVAGARGVFSVHPITALPTRLTGVFVRRVAVVPPLGTS